MSVHGQERRRTKRERERERKGGWTQAGLDRRRDFVARRKTCDLKLTGTALNPAQPGTSQRLVRTSSLSLSLLFYLQKKNKEREGEREEGRMDTGWA